MIKKTKTPVYVMDFWGPVGDG